MATQTALREAPTRGFRSLLVCLDRSSASEAVLPIAAHLANIDAARLTLLHVLESPPDTGEGQAIDALEWEIARQEARAYLETVAQRALALGVRADTRIGEGTAARGIAAVATEVDADLLVMTRFGEGGVEDWSLGSTAQKILAVSRSAVLVVPPDHREPAARVPPRRILVPLDGSLRGECVLPTALRFARASGAELVLAHAVPDLIRTELLRAPEDLALAEQLSDRVAAGAEVYLARIEAQLRASGARVTATVCRAGDHREGLVALGALQRADLILLSAHGCGCNPRSRFGSVARFLIDHASAPVLVLQDLSQRLDGAIIAEPPRMPPRSIDATDRSA